jgi:TonB family protein
MRFSRFEPRGRFRTIRARPCRLDNIVIGGGFLVTITVFLFVCFLYPLWTHQFYQVPEPDEMIRPVYPAEALEQGIEGEVLVRYLVDGHGEIIAPEIVLTNQPGVFDASVLETVSRWTYREFMHPERSPVSQFIMRFRFRLPEDPHAFSTRIRLASIIPEQVVFGPFDTPPVLVHRTEPVLYVAPPEWVTDDGIVRGEIPDSFRERWTRECLVTFTVDVDGQVKNPGFPRRGTHRFTRYSLDAPESLILDNIREWRFRPATRNGEAVSILVCQRIEYFGF